MDLSSMDPAFIQAMMSDPEIMRIMSHPGTMQKITQIMENPSLAPAFASSDPDIAVLMNKMQQLGADGAMGMPQGNAMPNPWAQSSSSAPIRNEVVVVLGLQQFNDIIRAEKVPVIVDFTATWCGPCRHISPAFDSMAKVYAGKAVFLKVDVDKNRDIAQTKRITSMPTFHFYLNGELVEEFSGANVKQLEDTVDRLVERSAPKQKEVAAPPSPYTNFPLRQEELVSYQQCKFDMIKTKLVEFNALPDCAAPLGEQELATIDAFVKVIADRTSFHRSTITAEQTAVIDKIVQNWRAEHLAPILNLLRMAAIHPGMHKWLTTRSNVLQLVTRSLPDNDAAISVLRMICNMFVRMPMKQPMIDQFEELHEVIHAFGQSPIGPIRLAYVTILINYAIIFLDPKFAETEAVHSSKIQLLSICSELLQSSKDSKTLHRLLIVLGSLVFRDTTCKAIAESLQLGDTCSQLQADLKGDPQIASVSQEFIKSLADDSN